MNKEMIYITNVHSDTMHTVLPSSPLPSHNLLAPPVVLRQCLCSDFHFILSSISIFLCSTTIPFFITNRTTFSVSSHVIGIKFPFKINFTIFYSQVVRWFPWQNSKQYSVRNNITYSSHVRFIVNGDPEITWMMKFSCMTTIGILSSVSSKMLLVAKDTWKRTSMSLLTSTISLKPLL